MSNILCNRRVRDPAEFIEAPEKMKHDTHTFNLAPMATRSASRQFSFQLHKTFEDELSTALVPLFKSGDDISYESDSHANAGQPSASGRLCILEHSVHKIGQAPSGADELVVSSLRPFQISVGLFGSDDLLVEDHDAVQLEARLLFENGQPCPTLPEQPGISGEFAMLSAGRATFKIRLNVLSSQRENRRFRVRIVDVSPGSRRTIKSVLSEPMRTITKLHRAPPGGGARAPAPEDYAPERQRDKRRLDSSLSVDEGLAKASLGELQAQVGEHESSIATLIKQNEVLMDLLQQMRGEFASKRARHDDPASGERVPAVKL